ncbi:MAG: response regulator [Chitinophagaceae bacterium]
MSSILIADKSQDVLEVMKVLLEKDGYEIKPVLSEKILFKELEHAIADIILLDTSFSGDKGKEICKEIKSNRKTRNIPIILMSTNDKLLSDHEECGAIDVLSKPFHFRDLKKKIKSVLELIDAD